VLEADRLYCGPLSRGAGGVMCRAFIVSNVLGLRLSVLLALRDNS
jgi:hypothetical protein